MSWKYQYTWPTEPSGLNYLRFLAQGRTTDYYNSIFKPVIATEEAPRSFNHLRRLVNFVHLPQEFCDRHGLRIQQEGTLFFLLPKCDSLTRDSILQTVDPHLEPSSRGTKPPIRVFETEVPGYPPKTGENAREWSIHLWPCMFNPASQIMQHAPPINLLRDTLQALDTDKTISYLNLANLVAKETKEANLGRHVGVVVVDPIKNEVVAVAGDARWWTAEDSFQQRSDSDPGEGRPEQHAMMRAIAMVAAKECRRRIKDGLRPATSNGDIEELEGKALTEVERRYLSAPEDDGQGLPSIAYEPKSQSEHRKDSYLCNGLDVYLSHEPCVCCSMAMIHSRFRACVFQKRMPGTGGLTAEAENGGLGYGLFWRKELNWRVMAFQTIEITNEGQQNPSTDHIFHV